MRESFVKEKSEYERRRRKFLRSPNFMRTNKILVTSTRLLNNHITRVKGAADQAVQFNRSSSVSYKELFLLPAGFLSRHMLTYIFVPSFV